MTLRERRQARLKRAEAKQRKAILMQRRRVKHFRRLRALIRRARSHIGARKRAIRQLKQELASGPVTIIGGGGPGNVHGGTPEQRLVACAKKAAIMHATGKRHSFYSQSGRWDYKHAIMGEPWGCRSDCSSWWIGICWAAGLKDPTGYNYTGGFTGTIGHSGWQVSAPGTPGGAGLYGWGNYHHVEMSMGDGSFIGHGTAAVDSLTPGRPNMYRDYRWEFA